MKKYNVKLKYTPGEWEKHIRGTRSWKTNLFKKHFDGEMEFTMEIPDTDPEAFSAVIDEFRKRGIPAFQVLESCVGEKFNVTGTVYQDSEGYWHDPIIADFTLDPDYLSIPDDYNEDLINIGDAIC